MIKEEEYLENISEKLREVANYIDEYLQQKKLRKILNEFWNEGKRTLNIYYPEEISIGEESWSADIYQDEINEKIYQNWTWTVTNKKLLELDIQSGEREKEDIPEWEIIVDGPFSEDKIIEAITRWLNERGFNFEVKMIPQDEAIRSGVFYRNLRDRLKEIEIEDR